MNEMQDLISIGTVTKFGTVEGVAFIEGERYYFLIDKKGTVSMMPQCAVAHLFSLETQATVKKPEA